MPAPPTYVDKINYIVQFWKNPCNAPLLVYLELAKAPLGRAILMWLTFGLADVARGFYRPSKALGGRPTQRRGKTGRKPRRIITGPRGKPRPSYRIPGIGDDTGGWLGKQLPGAEEVKGRHIGQGQINFWVLDDVGQKTLLALLIADISINFLYEWATLVEASEFCQRDQDGVLYATGPGSNSGGLFICAAGNAPNIVFKEGDVDWNTNVAQVGIRGWHFLSAMKLQNTGVFPILHYQELFKQDAFGTRTVRSEEQVIQPGQEFDSILKTQINGPGTGVSTHCTFGGLAIGSLQDVSIWGGGVPQP